MKSPREAIMIKRAKVGWEYKREGQLWKIKLRCVSREISREQVEVSRPVSGDCGGSSIIASVANG
jgi:hypothetical protein